MHPSHIAANGVEQQSVIPPPSTPAALQPTCPWFLQCLLFGLLLPPAFHFYLLFAPAAKKFLSLENSGVVICVYIHNDQSSMKSKHLGKFFTQFHYLKGFFLSCFRACFLSIVFFSQVYSLSFLHTVNNSITCLCKPFRLSA